MQERKLMSGVTLIETIIAVLILTVMVVSGFGFLEYCQRATVDSELRLQAAKFAAETMEGRYWNDNLANTAGWVNDTSLPAGAEYGSQLNNSYNGVREYRIATDGTGNYKIIQTKVKWDN